MKKIPLTQGKFALVDDEDFDWLNQWKWFAHYEPRSNDFYALRNESTANRKLGMPGRISMARVIMKTPKGLMCDHINLITLDNQKHNLRNCTVGENNRNKKHHKTSTTGYKGVFPSLDKFFARIGVDGKKIYIGRFETAELAAQAYNEYAIKYHGEFAHLNKIGGTE